MCSHYRGAHHSCGHSRDRVLGHHHSNTPRTAQTTQEQGITNTHPAAGEPGLEAPPAYDYVVGNGGGQTPLQNEKYGNAPPASMRGGWLAPANVESLSGEFGEMNLKGPQTSSPVAAEAGDRGTEPTGRRRGCSYSRGCGYGAELPPSWAEKLRRKEERAAAKQERKEEETAAKLERKAEEAAAKLERKAEEAAVKLERKAEKYAKKVQKVVGKLEKKGY